MAVSITLFLAINVIIENALGDVIEEEAWKFGAAAVLAPALMAALVLATDLGREMDKTFVRRYDDQGEETVVLFVNKKRSD